MIMILKKIKTKNGLKNRKRRAALTIARLYLMSQGNEFYILKQLKKQNKTKQNKSKETNEKSTQPLLSDISKRM